MPDDQLPGIRAAFLTLQKSKASAQEAAERTQRWGSARESRVAAQVAQLSKRAE